MTSTEMCNTSHTAASTDLRRNLVSKRLLMTSMIPVSQSLVSDPGEESKRRSYLISIRLSIQKINLQEFLQDQQLHSKGETWAVPNWYSKESEMVKEQ